MLSPLGLTVPLKRAELEVTEEAEPVVTVGADTVVPSVVKFLSLPYVVPPLLLATIR